MKSPYLRALFAALATLLALAASAQPAPPAGMRLGADVRPAAYDLALTLVPDEDGFRGRVQIDVDIARPLDFFWLNGSGLQPQAGTLTLRDGRALPVRLNTAGDSFIGVALPETVPAGRARLAIDYTGRYSTNETRGLFKQRDAGRAYVFTQFEAINARRAVPSFDEPHWKTPWTVSLTVKKEHVAVANTRAVAEADVGGGMKQVRFAPTPPLPSYLVAFAAGPFDVVEGGTAGRSATPLRYVVPQGRAGDTRFVKDATPRVLTLLESYFGTPYPFDKLDSVVIPITVNFWAMENPGLVTYRSSLMLAPREREDERFQQLYVAIGAHEIAHQWFGNLVTMQWWDDLWLKESFATWLARKTAREYNPEWDPRQFAEWARQGAFATDRLASTRRVRQNVETREDLSDAYDRITYDKGGTVLAMFEQWLGEAKFRDGVRRYMARHAWGNATADDFFAAVGGSDLEVVRAFRSFVTQPGMPLVDVELDCTQAQPAVRLAQRRFMPGADAAGDALWGIPVCLRHDGASDGKPMCTLLREREQRVVLPGAARCPAWVLPNPGGTGYYLSRLGPNARRGLAEVPLAPSEALPMLAEQTMLVNSGALPPADFLSAARALASDDRPEVVGAVAGSVHELHPALFDAAGHEARRQWVLQHLGPRAAALGWLPRAGESDTVRKLRITLLPAVVDVGRHPQLMAEARGLALE
jgi:alanyl aminopeptidase